MRMLRKGGTIDRDAHERIARLEESVMWLTKLVLANLAASLAMLGGLLMNLWR